MHAQIRSMTALSPADVGAFLAVLADPANGEPINIEGVAGSSLETGGRLALSLPHERRDEAVHRLRGFGYEVEEVPEVYSEEIPVELQFGTEDPNQPGRLWQIVANAKASPIAAGRPIHEILIGAVTGEPGRFYVQVTFADADFFDPAAP